MDSQNKDCSEAWKIEYAILKKFTSKFNFQDINSHLENCSSCQKFASECKQFYSILFTELLNPVTNNIFNLLQNLEGDKITIVGILLEPQLLDEMPGERHFISKIIQRSDYPYPSANSDWCTLHIKKDEVLIRAIQSSFTHETTLYLYSEDKKLYSNIVLKIPKIKKIYSSDIKGKIDVGALDISGLDNLDIAILTK